MLRSYLHNVMIISYNVFNFLLMIVITFTCSNLRPFTSATDMGQKNQTNNKINIENEMFNGAMMNLLRYHKDRARICGFWTVLWVTYPQ